MIIENESLREHLKNKRNAMVSRCPGHAQLLGQLSFTLNRLYLDTSPYARHFAINIPSISEHWYSDYHKCPGLDELRSREHNFDVHLHYNFSQLDEELFSLVFQWIFYHAETGVNYVTTSVFELIESHVAFMATNAPNRTLFNKYVDVWINTINSIEEDQSFTIHAQSLVEHLNAELDRLRVIFSANKR